MIKRRNRRSALVALNEAQPRDPVVADARTKPSPCEGVSGAASGTGRTGDRLLAGALLVILALVYQPAWQGGFIWDDDLHLLDNPVLKPGGLAKIWVPGGYMNYWPLTYTVYWIEFKLWGLNPLGFHLVNISLHGISALLIWRILAQLRVPGALFAAAIFALHPVNVESVAWISQLKGLLSLMFGLLSMLFFLRWEKGEPWASFLAIGAFVLSTLAKGMVITLPAVLLACAWWQRGRIGRQDLLRVLPYLLIGAVMAATEIWGQHYVVLHGDVRTDGLLSRAAIAGCAVWFYFWKVIWPVNLCFVYPRWQIDDGQLLSYLPGLLLVAFFALAWWKRRTWGRSTLVLMVGYVGLLFPALGFVNIYFMRYSYVADHWQYAAMIVPCAIFAGMTATWFCQNDTGSRKGYYLLCAVILATLSGLSWRQARMYTDVETLYRTTLERNRDCWLISNNLGVILADRGKLSESIAYYQQSLKAKPDYAEAHNNLGLSLVALRRFDEAIDHYQKAVKSKPKFADAYNNLGTALALCGRVEEGIAQMECAITIKPDLASAHKNLGIYLARSGRIAEAIAALQRAVELMPDSAENRNNLGLALATRGSLDEAIDQYRRALQIKPDYADALNNLANALKSCGRLAEAMSYYSQALQVDPNNAQTHHNVANALEEQGQIREAVVHRRKAVELAPNNTAILNAAAWMFATCPDPSGRNGVEAMKLADRAARITNGQDPEILDSLAAAYAEAGRFSDAVDIAQQALKQASARGEMDLAAGLRDRIKLYESGTAFRDPRYAPHLPSESGPVHRPR